MKYVGRSVDSQEGTGHIRNDNIMDKGQVETISATYNTSWFRWFGHAKRRKQQSVCRCTLETMPLGREIERKTKIKVDELH